MCWTICPKGFFADPVLGKCTLCTDSLNCVACTYNASNQQDYCTSCKYGYYFQSSSSTCGTTCLSTQYQNTWNNSCNDCDAACATCNGPTSFSCTSCANTFYLLTNATGGYCVTTCPTIGYIEIGVNCQPCDSTCSSCNGVNANECANCSANYYFHSGYCRYVCPNATYGNSSTWQCSNCDSTCNYCFGGNSSSCTSCATALYLYNFTCVATCPDGMLPNTYNVCYESYLVFMMIVLLLFWL